MIFDLVHRAASVHGRHVVLCNPKRKGGLNLPRSFMNSSNGRDT
jgi:hypothetical protein